MAEICREEAKSAPAAALSARRRRVEMAVAGGSRFAGDLEPPWPLAADDGGARAGKRQRLSCAASMSCPRPGAGFRSRWWPMYGVTSVCGPRREMEDAVSIRPDFLPGSPSGKHHFFGVFDSHGCSHVARICQDRMHEVVVDAYRKAVSGSQAPAATAWKEAMEKGFARMDDKAASWAASRTSDDTACRCELQTPPRCDHVGSTAVVAVVGSTHVVDSSLPMPATRALSSPVPACLSLFPSTISRTGPTR